MPASLLPDGRLAIPPNYEAWVNSLRDYLDRTGESVELIKRLRENIDTTEGSARVKLSRILNGHHPASIDVFFIITHWLAERQGSADV